MAGQDDLGTIQAAVAGDTANSADWPTISSGNLARLWEHPARAMGRRWARWDDVWAADAETLEPYLNSATLARSLDADRAGELVGRLRAFYASGGGGPWMLWSAWPAPDLRAHGLHLIGHPPLMVRPAGPISPPPSDLRIVEVGDEEMLAAFNAVMIDGYPLSEFQAAGVRSMWDARILGGPYRLWVGFVEDRPVSIASAYVGERAVGIYAVATLPEARGKGYGAALTAHATQAAPELPAELQSSDDGRPIYLRLGFQIVTEYALWMGQRSEA